MPINGKKKRAASLFRRDQTSNSGTTQHNDRTTHQPTTRQQQPSTNNEQESNIKWLTTRGESFVVLPSKKTIDGKERKIQQQSRVFLAKEKNAATTTTTTAMKRKGEMQNTVNTSKAIDNPHYMPARPSIRPSIHCCCLLLLCPQKCLCAVKAGSHEV